MSGTALGILFTLGIAPLPAAAQELPSGGSVTSGTATITTAGPNLLVNQTSQNAILSWQSFSVGGNASAHFENGTGATLNRVTGNLPSAIDGSLTATGSLYLINPAGVAVGTGGMVRTGGSFVASTHDVTDADFLDGGDLTLKGTSKAGIVNRGFVTSLSGDVVLTARRVENSGAIDAPEGSVGLLGGYEVLLRDTSLAEGKFAVKVGGADTEVVNTGTVRAAEIEMRANGGSVQALAGNTKAIVKATGVKKVGGRIFLTAGKGGTVKATQRIVARRALQPAQRQGVAALPDNVPVPFSRPDYSGGEVHVAGGSISLGGMIDVAGSGGNGGAIVAVAGHALTLTGSAALDASGSDGGLVLLGGDYQGGKDASGNYWSTPLGTTAQTRVAKGATITADGVSGAGGNVVVWADDHTSFAGAISATGVTAGGDAEVSGKAVLDFAGTADLTSDAGTFGTLLLDPYNVTISTGADTGTGFTATGDNSVINATTLLAALNTANVTVSTGAAGSPGGQAGDITVSAPLAWTSDATLTLDAAGYIAINAAVTARAGGLTLNAGGAIVASGAIDIARFTLASGDWFQINPTLPAFAAGDFRIDGGTFQRTTGGDGTTATPWTLADIYGVQGMGTHLDGTFALVGDIDAAGTKYWNGGLGFAPVGSYPAGFTGSFDGQDHAISGLTIARPTQGFVGLFGYANADIRNVGLDGGVVTGRTFVGGLMGTQSGGTISQAWASGVVNGDGDGDNVGGLVGGQFDGTISQAWASGKVSGTSRVGGLVGYQGGDITQAWASGAVTGDYGVGGLVGYQQTGTISQAWASGAVTGSVRGGGLVGDQYGGSVTDSFWDIGSTGRATSAGGAGAVGLSTADARSQTPYLMAGWDFATGWYQAGDLRPIGRWMANDAVQGDIAVSNLVQLQLMGADLAAHYVLTRDIDASATAANATNPAGIWGAGGFVPVGGPSANFTGSFDGQSHVISGLTIARPGQNYVGLFGYAQGATIGHVGLDGGAVTGVGAVGGLVGYQTGGKISQAWASGTVTGGGTEVGGLVGFQTGGGTIGQAWASGAVTGFRHVGGLVGSQQGSGTISQAWASGAVTGFDQVGGLVGYQQTGTIEQSWASGKVTGINDNDVGGLLGNQIGGTVTASFWDAGTTLQGSSAGGAGAVGLTTADARDKANYATWDFTNDWYQQGDLRPIGRWMAATPVGGVTDISSLLQLQLMGADPSGSYRLTRDIDASATAAATNPSSIWSAGGFVPVGYDTDNSNSVFNGIPFTGSLDGQSHAISGLTIARPTHGYVGLFGYTDGATIGHVGLDGGAVSGSYAVGGLVGYQHGGAISQAWASGTVDGVNGNIGGLVGEQFDGATISQAWASGRVNGKNAVGGLVGYQYDSAISQAWASGKVTGISKVGGLVGSQDQLATISQAWASGAVSGNSFVGGLVGWQRGTITQAWASGAVTGVSAVAGLVGNGPGNSSVTASFWDKDTTLQADGLGGGSGSGATGLTTAQFQDTAGFMALAGGQGWDFKTVWAPPSAGFYPQLYAMFPIVAVDPSSRRRLYGDDSASVALNYYGLRPGDFLTTRATLSGADTTTGVGVHAVTASGGATTNTNTLEAYRFVTIPGSLTIDPRAITVSANDLSRLYGDANPALTFGSVIGGDGLASFDADLAAAGYGLTTTASAASPVGGYGIGLTGTNANYAMTFAPGTLSVAQRAITVSANDQSRLYGDANPALIWILTGGSLASFDNAGTVFSGLLATAADAASPVGSYAITQGGFVVNANYAMTFTGGTLSVGQRSITVTANDLSRLLGQPDPALTWTLTGGSLASFDTTGTVFSGGLTRAPGEVVGDYAIGQGSLTTNANYTLGFLGGVFTIDPAAMAQDQVLERSLAGQSFFMASSGGDGDGSTECAEGVLGPVCAASVNPGNRSLGPNISWQAP